VKWRIVQPLDRDWREEGAAMAVVRRVMVVRRDGKCIMMVGDILMMLYEGNWFCWEWNWSGLFVWIQKEERVEVLVLPTSVISFLVKSNSRL
jgi:hypothetical protein